jgi:hypothetical protein
MTIIVRCRRWLARHPRLAWTLVTCCLLGAAWSFVARHQALSQTQAQWGRRRPVWVASGDIAPGETIVAIRRDYPDAMVPDAALATSPGAATARQTIADGEVLVAADVHGAGLSATVAEGSLAISMPLLAGFLGDIGDRVAVLADGMLLANGTVVAVTPDAVVVSVPIDTGGAVSAAVERGTVVVAIAPDA